MGSKIDEETRKILPKRGFSDRDWGGEESKIIHMPWGWNKRRGDYRREYLGEGGEWHNSEVFPHNWITEEEKGPQPQQVSKPYPYLTNSGEFQDDITATAHMERTYSVFRIFGAPVKRRVEYYINVEFDKEVGNRRGSWKGGTIGCSFRMKPREAIEDALRRMRVERRFCR